jgi:hypothetical protein
MTCKDAIVKIVEGKLEGKKPLGQTVRVCYSNTRLTLKEIYQENMDLKGLLR